MTKTKYIVSDEILYPDTFCTKNNLCTAVQAHTATLFPCLLHTDCSLTCLELAAMASVLASKQTLICRMLHGVRMEIIRGIATKISTVKMLHPSTHPNTHTHTCTHTLTHTPHPFILFQL